MFQHIVLPHELYIFSRRTAMYFFLLLCIADCYYDTNQHARDRLLKSTWPFVRTDAFKYKKTIQFLTVSWPWVDRERAGNVDHDLTWHDSLVNDEPERICFRRYKDGLGKSTQNVGGYPYYSSKLTATCAGRKISECSQWIPSTAKELKYAVLQGFSCF